MPKTELPIERYIQLPQSCVTEEQFAFVHASCTWYRTISMGKYVQRWTTPLLCRHQQEYFCIEVGAPVKKHPLWR